MQSEHFDLNDIQHEPTDAQLDDRVPDAKTTWGFRKAF